MIESSITYLSELDFTIENRAVSIVPCDKRLVFYYISNCARCRKLLRIYKELAKHSRIRLCVIDVLAISPELAQAIMRRYMVIGLMCYVFLFNEDGKYVDVYRGGLDINSLRDFIDSI